MGALAKTGALLAGVALVGYLPGRDTGAAGTSCAVPGYTSEQVTNAATIVRVGREMGVPERGWVVAVATAQQESGLRNLSYGDRDSLGLFQQRPSMGWGTRAQVLDPRYAATKFYQRLVSVRGWQRMSLTDAAQAVQESGFPGAYARHEHTSADLVAAVHGPRCQGT